MEKIKKNYLLILIIILALFLRTIFINNVPPSINWDEASLGYNAYSILKTGRDEWGRVLPASFEAFGDYKLPGYIYTLVPFIAIFGLSEISVKIPSILSGVISVFLVYLIVEGLTKRKDWAILTSFLLAISPWHIFLSRIALEANLALGFFLAGLYFLITGLEKGKRFIWASIFLGLSLFTYNSARVFIPLFLLGFVFIFRERIKQVRKKILIPVLVILLFLVTAFYLAVAQDSSSRYYWVSILDQGAIDYLNEARNKSEYPQLVTNLLYNRYTYFLQNFTINYLSHFSPQFLILEGGSNYQFSLPKTGLIYFVEFPFFLLGIFFLMKEKKLRNFFLLWLLFAPIPAAITRESPHALRAIFSLGVLQAISAFGIIKFGPMISQTGVILVKIWKILLIAGFIISVVFYMDKYLFEYPIKYSQSWQYGYKQAYSTILGKEEKPIYVTKRYGEPHIFYLFLSKYEPSKYQNNPNLIRYARSNWRWVDKLDNLYFINDWEIKDKLKDAKGSLLITSPDNFPDGRMVKSSVYFLDGSKAFDVVEL